MKCVYGRAGVRHVITKFSRMDSLPNFLTHGAPLRALRAPGSSAKTHQSTYPETFAHVSPYFDKPLLSKEFVLRKLVKGESWDIFSAIVSTLRHATVISVRHVVDFYTRALALVTKVHDVNPKWLLCDKGE